MLSEFIYNNKQQGTCMYTGYCTRQCVDTQTHTHIHTRTHTHTFTHVHTHTHTHMCIYYTPMRRETVNEHLYFIKRAQNSIVLSAKLNRQKETHILPCVMSLMYYCTCLGRYIPFDMCDSQSTYCLIEHLW